MILAVSTRAKLFTRMHICSFSSSCARCRQLPGLRQRTTLIAWPSSLPASAPPPNNPQFHQNPIPDICPPLLPKYRHQIGRASCRERVCQYVSISGGAETLKKKKKKHQIK